MSTGVFALPCRLLLPMAQRDRLERLCRGRDQDINEVVSAIVQDYLDQLPDDQLAAPRVSEVPGHLAPHHDQQRELRRLRLRQQQLGSDSPAWIAEYIAELEAEIVSEQRLAHEEQQ